MLDKSQLTLTSLAFDKLSKQGYISIYTYSLFLGHQRRILNKRKNKQLSLLASRKADNYFWQQIINEIFEKPGLAAKKIEFYRSYAQMPLLIAERLLALHDQVRPDLQRLTT